ncbi:hypothetical protein JDV02_001862 [Purpureocillium takamizusanense]|uniref:Uncharacterized protein n=1 Tax=Purpureocillium takamizusanense TaxID=2060973 RepID=A0A9Q8V7Z1_9HYPO|nr:uncharacterized protein JDV02_001862 [Purpureocillium takamizusanense]UNI15319.1 hypothetical protein JDV02_001862 [Purpureocillium takamizusanense]
MRYSSVLTLAALFAAAAAAPLTSEDHETINKLNQLAIDHPDIKGAVESVLYAEYGGLRPAKREDGEHIKATLTQLAIDHPEVQGDVESILKMDYVSRG